MDMVARLVDQKPLVIFSKSSCCMSHSIKTFLYDFGANPRVYELDQMPNGQQIERVLLQLGCRPSVPAVFIGQQFIGGTNTVMSLHMQNKLVPLLMRAKAIWIWNDK
ncbi:hypothetical protein ACLB2K_014254 [Fragaria x ananassa]